jgi:hypothetical protein
MTADERHDTELAYYKEHKQELTSKHAGLFALVKTDRLVAVFPTHLEAYKHGLELFNIEPFLVAKIVADEPVNFIPTFSTAPHAGL